MDEGQRLIEPFLDLQPTNTNISYLPWQDIQNTSFYGLTVKGCVPGVDHIPYSVNLYEIDVDSLINVVNFMNQSMSQTPALQACDMAFTQYAPHGFGLYADDSSAFPFRDVIVYT